MKLFNIEPDNIFRVPLLVNFDEDRGHLSNKEWLPLLKDWHPLSFYFHVDKQRKGENKIPDICIFTDGLFLRTDLIDDVFPEKPVELEFLPVLIDENNWRLINCLKTTKDYDENRSKFVRSNENNQIYMINHLVIYDTSVEKVGLFTLEDSNRAWLFATESFVKRITKLGLKGINFREIGSLETHNPQ